MTIKDIAKMAEVSTAAVSRYMNGGSLSAEKKERIRAVMEQTNFRPNMAGSLLRTNRINQIGVIVPKINSESVSQVAAGIANELTDSQYLFMLGNCNENTDLELQYLSIMQENHVSGIILMGTCISAAHEAAFAKCKVPLVVTGQNFPGVPCVYHDDFNAAKELTQRMLAKGRRRIAYIGVQERDPAAGLARRKGVQAALNEAGLDGEHMPRLAGTFDHRSGLACMTELLAMDPALDGVICATDVIAIGAMDALKKAGRCISQDVGLAGLGNSWPDTIVDPPLTSVDLYQVQCGQVAARMLLAQLADGSAEQRALLHTQIGYTLVDRGSL